MVYRIQNIRKSQRWEEEHFLPYWVDCVQCVSNGEMMLCTPGWESASVYQTTSSMQGEIFIAGKGILSHSSMFIMLCLKQG